MENPRARRRGTAGQVEWSGLVRVWCGRPILCDNGSCGRLAFWCKEPHCTRLNPSQQEGRSARLTRREPNKSWSIVLPERATHLEGGRRDSAGRRREGIFGGGVCRVCFWRARVYQIAGKSKVSRSAYKVGSSDHPPGKLRPTTNTRTGHSRPTNSAAGRCRRDQWRL